MKKVFSLLMLFSILVVAYSFKPIQKTDDNFCDDVKKITTIFNNKEFTKLKGKVIPDETSPNDKQYVSAIELKGYFSQLVYDNDKEISFYAILKEDFFNAEALRNKLNATAEKLKKCLATELEFDETKNFLNYTAVLESGVEVKLSGSYPNEKRRAISIEIVYKK